MSSVDPKADETGVLTRLVRARGLGPQAVDEVRAGIERDSTLGLSYLGVGATLVGVLMLVRGVTAYLAAWRTDPEFLVLGVAWALVIVAFVAVQVLVRSTRGRLPSRAFAGLLACDAVALAADLWVTAVSPSAASFTIAIGVGATLVGCVAVRSTVEILGATSALGAILLAVIVAQSVATGVEPGSRVAYAMVAVVPPYAAVWLVRAFSTFVQRTLDRSVVESTIGTARFSTGILASKELSRLDLEAEELLRDVAQGDLPLPLPSVEADRAAALASRLRVRLIGGRKETWLHHALAESEVLGPVVTLEDPDGSAAYLDPRQRDGLLSAIWLLADDSALSDPRLHITVGRRRGSEQSVAVDMMVLPIVLSITGLARRRVDPAVWPALERVGRYTEDARRERIRIRVDAVVAVPDASR
ncbi:hypothetical protein NY547_05470 [Cnuibacter physcomitrellae]|uniref:hypothetical protein n=1 Tax=Cnuibacter physcomitrellae TaxID=1619308 RepID=UPI002175CCC3|nr:hypothetical protein [Cnuibacter physcomitrellae]MCS5496688.1 hypothetical protein [Cnuibacter physcomitrellae]